MAEQLVDLIIEEVSGVDHPATLVEGWLVVKQATKPDDAPITDDVDAEVTALLAKADAYAAAGGPPPAAPAAAPATPNAPAAHGDPIHALIAVLEAAKPQLESAPDEVKAAANALYAYAKSMAGGAAAPAAPAPPAAPAHPAPAPTGFSAARKAFVQRVIAKLSGAVADDSTDIEEDHVKPEDIAEIAKAVKDQLAADAAAEATAAAAADAAAVAKAAEDEAAATAAADAAAAAALAAAGETVADAGETLVKAVKTELDAETAAHAVTREALEKTLERVERIERMFTKSKQVPGQETNDDGVEVDKTPVAKSDAEIFGGLRDQAARAGANPNVPTNL